MRWNKSVRNTIRGALMLNQDLKEFTRLLN
jgi:hypothetical protein